MSPLVEALCAAFASPREQHCGGSHGTGLLFTTRSSLADACADWT
jgi:hypothetical protein